MTLLFFQSVLDTAQRAGEAIAGTPAKKESMFNLLANGGPLMIPLALLLVLAIFFFVERFIAIKKASSVEGNFMNIIRDHIMNGNISAARSLAKNTDNAVARMIDKGLQRVGKPIEAIEKSMENVAKLEMYKMEKNTAILSSIAKMAPLFGFLGTIAGMIQLFSNINETGKFELNIIAGGIYVKMITSATGLIIGILAYAAYNYTTVQIDKTANKLEVSAAEFLDILQEPTK